MVKDAASCNPASVPRTMPIVKIVLGDNSYNLTTGLIGWRYTVVILKHLIVILKHH